MELSAREKELLSADTKTLSKLWEQHWRGRPFHRLTTRVERPQDAKRIGQQCEGVVQRHVTGAFGPRAAPVDARITDRGTEAVGGIRRLLHFAVAGQLLDGTMRRVKKKPLHGRGTGALGAGYQLRASDHGLLAWAAGPHRMP